MFKRHPSRTGREDLSSPSQNFAKVNNRIHLFIGWIYKIQKPEYKQGEFEVSYANLVGLRTLFDGPLRINFDAVDMTKYLNYVLK